MGVRLELQTQDDVFLGDFGGPAAASVVEVVGSPMCHPNFPARATPRHSI